MEESDRSTSDFEEHPIQLRALNVRELHIETHVPAESIGEIESSAYSILVGHGDYDGETVQVGVKLNAGDEDPAEAPFALAAELVGEFEVDEDRFPVERLGDWARENAPYILLPYLREHVFALTNRCGLDPMLLPLATVPTKEQTD